MHLKFFSALGLLPGLLAAHSIKSRGVKCSFSASADPSDTCGSLAAYWGLTMDELKSLNPDIDCDNFDVTKTYCVIGSVTTDEPTTTTSRVKGTTTTPDQTPTTTSKEPVDTCNPTAPSPTQPGVICGCTEWHKVESYTSCNSIYNYYSISPSDFDKWNPQVGTDCKSLWLGYYVCIAVPDTPTHKPTTTKDPVETCNPAAPSPTQPGVICGCNMWHKVESYTTCNSIYNYYGVSPSNFDEWNPTVGRDCKSLWLGYYVCIAVPGTPIHKSTSTKTPVETCNPAAPSPTQPGVICGCNKWHMVASTTTCSNIYNYYDISPVDFDKWNPTVGRDCKSLWRGYNVCIGVAGASPTKCNPSAPSPTQPGVVCGCKKWHEVASTTTCSNIYNYFNVSPAQFAKWNPEVGADCKHLWLHYYVCVDK